MDKKNTPEVKLGQYKGLSAPRPQVELSDDDVTAAIDEYLQGHLTEEHPKKAAMGDEVVLDFEGFVNGVPFEGGKAEEYPLLLGSGYFIPGFEEQVAGMAVGDERDIPVTFPTQYAPELAGKDAVFHIKVHKITRRARPVRPKRNTAVMIRRINSVLTALNFARMVELLRFFCYTEANRNLSNGAAPGGRRLSYFQYIIHHRRKI